MVFSLFYTILPFWKVWVQIAPKALMSKNKKSLHVRRHTIFPLKIVEEQKKDLHAARSLPSSGVEEFFLQFL